MISPSRSGRKTVPPSCGGRKMHVAHWAGMAGTRIFTVKGRASPSFVFDILGVLR
jgi:hypothetical protein